METLIRTEGRMIVATGEARTTWGVQDILEDEVGQWTLLFCVKTIALAISCVFGKTFVKWPTSGGGGERGRGDRGGRGGGRLVHLLFLKNPLCELYEVKLLSNLNLFRGRGDWSGGPRGGGRGGPPGEVFQNVLEMLENWYFMSVRYARSYWEVTFRFAGVIEEEDEEVKEKV